MYGQKTVAKVLCHLEACCWIPLLVPWLFQIASTTTLRRDNRMPTYIIAHMVNSIPEISEYLGRGANVLESDISFFDNGTVYRVFHGGPIGDCNRDLYRSANISQYLDYLRSITDHQTGKYSGKLVFQFFDLKLTNLIADGKLIAGESMADQVLDHLWKNTTGSDRVRALIYINDVSDNQTVVGFRQRFKERGVDELLKYVGFDGGVGGIPEIEAMWKSIGVNSSIWQGDGIINCFSTTYTDIRLRQELAIRNEPNGYISKVYHWTIDDKRRMSSSLSLGVDGMITNFPELLVDIVRDAFTDLRRIADLEDDPFEKYVRT